MSLKFHFVNDKFFLDKLLLPSRYYYFNEDENYIKLLNIGEGYFPNDKINANIELENSNLILSTESATKIYPTNKEKKYAVNYIDISLQNSNFEFLNDELILYKDSKYIQLFRLKFDENSTFFYSDILSSGRSYEKYEFGSMVVKNSFFCENSTEYIEKFDISGDSLKDYLNRRELKDKLFAKIYLKVKNSDDFFEDLKENGFDSFSKSSNENIILGVLSSDNMSKLKRDVLKLWNVYRKSLDKSSFNLGKI